MKCPGKRMRHLIKHLGIIHNDLAGSCLDLIINLVTTSGIDQTGIGPLSIVNKTACCASHFLSISRWNILQLLFMHRWDGGNIARKAVDKKQILVRMREED